MLRQCILFYSLIIGPLFAQYPTDMEQYQLQYNSGNTIASIFSYHVKFVAEQRYSDSMAEVVVIPQEQGISFQIQSVDFIVMPPSNDVSGPVAQIEGTFRVQINQQNPVSIPKTVQVMVSSVEDFSVSGDEATIQGYPVFQKQLSQMLSDEVD